MIHPSFPRRWILLVLLAAGTLVHAQSWPTEDLIDIAASSVERDGKAIAFKPDDIYGALGLRRSGAWRATDADGPEEAKAVYTLAFTRPIELGSLQVTGVSGVETRASATAEWQRLARQPRTRSVLFSATFDPGTQVQALRFTQPQRRYGSDSLGYIRLTRERLYSITPIATANAASHYTAYYMFSPPQVFSPTRITQGSGSWQNNGVGRGEDYVHGPPVTELNPTWFVLSWDSPRTLQSLVLQGNVTKFELYEWIGPVGINPSTGTQEEWRKIRGWNRTAINGDENGGFHAVHFEEPVKTYGLKLLITGVSANNREGTDQVATLEAVNVYENIGDAPPPVPASDLQPSPFTFPFTLPAAGSVSLVINRADGTRVKNLFARHTFAAGDQTADWNLSTENGGLVQPGTYHWEIVTGPEIVPVYEMTPYPNVSNFHPENSPWRNGHSGRGGWLADHGVPSSVTTSGDRVYIGSPVCESGESLLEADLDGKRLWGHGNFDAWIGPKYLASNADTVFVGAKDDVVYTVQRATKRVGTALAPEATYNRLRGMRGIAVDAEHLYMSINASGNWLTNAASANDVDLAACTPRYPPMKKTNQYFEPDPQNEFMRLFRLKLTPSGQRGALIQLESTSMPDLRQHIVLAFNRKVPIGSLSFPFPVGDYVVRLSTYEAEVWPPDPWKDENWKEFYSAKSGAWSVIPAPEGTESRALRITFDKRQDAFDDMLGDLGEKRDVWKGLLDGMKLLRRRFANHTPTATVRVNSGKLQADGSWDAKRDTPLSEGAPGIYMLEWADSKALRGLAIKEIDGKRTLVDVYTGPPGEITISGDENWENVASYAQERRYFYQPDSMRNHLAVYMDGYVDFGRTIETRAVRLRVVEQWTTGGEGREALYGVHEDRGGMTKDPTRCRVYGVAALEYLGGEVPVDPMISERLEIYGMQATEKDGLRLKLLRELPLTNGDRLALAPDGGLVGIVDGHVMRIDTQTGATTLITDDCILPDGLAYDSTGALYVFDRGGDRQNIRVYDAAGTYQRSIGDPGGITIGAWNPRAIGHGRHTRVDIAIDARDQLWVVAAHDTPKRTSVWNARTGEFIREHLGNTRYGGGGVLSRWDKRQVFYGSGYSTMEFELDWETGATRLKNILWLGKDEGGELPIRIDDREYLVTRPMFGRQNVGIVYLRDGDRIRPVAAVGLATSYRALRTPAIEASLGARPLADMQFIWSDLNGDGSPTPDEVQFRPAEIKSVSWFDRKLGIQAGAARFEVEKYLPNGSPVYVYTTAGKFPQGQGLHLDSGAYAFFLQQEELNGKAAYAAAGTSLWTYRHEGYGVHAISSARPLHPEQVVSEFDIIGFEPHPNLGEVFVTNSNIGRWNLWTHDGILAGEVMTDRRDPRLLSWTMPRGDRHMPLPGLTPGSEHFSGHFTRSSEDGRYYLVAGHNHISILELQGLADYKRLHGTLTVSPDDVRKVAEWESLRQAESVYRRAPLFTMRPAEKPRGDDAPAQADLSMEEGSLGFSMSYSGDSLYVTWIVNGHGPFKNRGENWRTLFKTGASVDLQLQTDPDAPLDRKNPAPGDIRLLIAPYRDGIATVVYQPVAPGAAADAAWTTRTLVYETSFDRVEQLSAIRVSHQTTDSGYTVNAIIPFSAIGLKLKEGQRLKFDWGVLTTGPDGVEVLQRLYWANKSTAIISDEAAEARISPQLWGTLLVSPKKDVSFTGNAAELMGEEKKMSREDILDFLEE